MTPTRTVLPAEWEPQAAILIAWPHAGTDWASRLSQVERTYVALVAAIVRFQHAVICVPDAELEHEVRRHLETAEVDLQRVRFVQRSYDDTWLRDSGPITLRTPEGFRLLDFRFTGWGGKFEASRDDELVSGLVEAGVFVEAEHRRIDWALEGGAIESDGAGSILTTWRCLHQRHPQQTREAITAMLTESLAADRVLWLEHGYLQGDDTDAHIDTLARFAPGDAIVYQHCDDVSDPHHAELELMRRELEALRTRDGAPYRLHALPWAAPVVDDGRRLAASYANYLVLNDAVLAPAYDDPSDEVAAAVLAAAHPGRRVVQIPCRPLIWQNGSLHCVTMQLPAGLLASA
ncbi:agmatine deiminase family protein [Oleiagrimonas citrea]|uniref:Agmatine deiminase family protein n=1 Tax=Oleiagrimonas citrea TaxID=1665687 RepID=A0A846ZCE5_9GAMM|nr:agmatine deiminase family protein [Oleiagrimonas citrea]NKZ37395.1 agmatine deiminase family protein [Oleiagrimonas citrea]